MECRGRWVNNDKFYFKRNYRRTAIEYYMMSHLYEYNERICIKTILLLITLERGGGQNQIFTDPGGG